MDGVAPSDVKRVLERGGLRILERRGRNVDFVLWNLRHPILADPEIRRALTLATDRDGYNRRLFGVPTPIEAVLAIGTVPPLVRGATPEDVRPLPFDPLAAERLLDGRGWRRPAPGAVREKEGKALTIQLLVNTETPRRRQTAVLLQQDLARVGVDLRIEELSMAALQPRIVQGRFEGSIWGWVGSLQLKQGDVWRTGSPFNFQGYSNPRVDALVEGLGDEVDGERVRARLRDLQRIVHEDEPVTFLCWFSRIVAVRDRFRNLGSDSLTFVGRVDECFVPRRLQRSLEGQ
jgi:peptide/nickel transport system substrate-binding protein